MRINKILIEPVVTEKAMDLHNREGMYTFKVDLWANKEQIKNSLKDTFGVEAYDIKTLVMPGKRKRIGKTAKFGRTSMTKKVIFKLKKGKLDFYTGS